MTVIDSDENTVRQIVTVAIDATVSVIAKVRGLFESLAIDDITNKTYITVWVACILESRTMAIIVACRSNVNVVQ
jgi:hypothetical protein